MKKTIFGIAIATIIFFGSCSTTQTLYYWGPDDAWKGVSQYENAVYKNYRNQTPETVCRLIFAYETMVTNPAGSRQVPPPGICAEYGYLLLNPETATIFAANATNKQRRIFDSDDYSTLFAEYGARLMAREIELYPESAIFIKPLLERFKSQHKQQTDTAEK